MKIYNHFNTMKNLVLTCLIFLGTVSLAVAQPEPLPTREKIAEKVKQERIDFVKKKLALTAEEEKKFTPLYTRFIDDIDNLRKTKMKGDGMEDIDLTFMTDEECEKVINDFVAFKEKELNTIKSYVAEFKKILPVKKVAMIFKAEQLFKKEMIKKIRHHVKKGDKPPMDDGE